MSYTKVDDVVQGIWQSGVGSMLAKIDIKNAYRVVPVHPVDRHLLATGAGMLTNCKTTPTGRMTVRLTVRLTVRY